MVGGSFIVPYGRRDAHGTYRGSHVAVNTRMRGETTNGPVPPGEG